MLYAPMLQGCRPGSTGRVEAGLGLAEAAKLFGVTQPRVSDLVRGKINLFGPDALVSMTTAAGLQIEMRVLEAA